MVRVGRLGLLGPEELLVQLLAGAQAGVHDLGPACPDCSIELPGDVGDAHRLAHVEHERLAGLADRGGLDDQLHGLLRPS